MSKKDKNKTYTTKQVMAKLKKAVKKKQPIVNAHLKKHLQQIINDEIGKEYRSQAMKLLMKANRQEVADFLFTHYSDGTSAGLIGCALDFIKNRLVKDGEVEESFAPKFGLDLD